MKKKNFDSKLSEYVASFIVDNEIELDKGWDNKRYYNYLNSKGITVELLEYIERIGLTPRMKKYLTRVSSSILKHMKHHNLSFDNFNIDKLTGEFYQALNIGESEGVRAFFQSLPGQSFDKYDLPFGRSLGNFYAKNLTDFVNYNLGGKAVYYTPNPLRSYSGANQNVLGIKSVYIDLDFRSGNDEKETILPLDLRLHRMKIALEDTEIPYPTAVVDSGSGLHLYWIFDEIMFDNSKNKVMINLAETLTRDILQRFKRYDYMAIKEKQPEKRVYPDMKVFRANHKLRYPGARTKHDYITCRVVELHKTKIYNDFFDFASEVWPKFVRPEDYEPVPTPKVEQLNEYKSTLHKRVSKRRLSNDASKEYAKIINILDDSGSINEWIGYNSQRFADFNRIIKMRKGNLVGMRNEFLFIVVTQLSVTGLDLDQLHDWNNRLNPKLPSDEVNKLITHQRRKKYNCFKSVTICDSLELSEEEQALLSVISENPMSTRDLERATQRKLSASKKAYRQIIAAEYHQFMTNKEIMALLDRSLRSVQQYRQEYHELSQREKDDLLNSLPYEQRLQVANQLGWVIDDKDSESTEVLKA